MDKMEIPLSGYANRKIMDLNDGLMGGFVSSVLIAMVCMMISAAMHDPMILVGILAILAVLWLLGELFFGRARRRKKREILAQNEADYADSLRLKEVLEKLDTKMTQAFNAVLEMSLKEKVYTRDAAYMVAIDRVVKAMKLRGWSS